MRGKRFIQRVRRGTPHVVALGLVSVLLASCGGPAVQPTPVVIVITVVTIATPEPTMTPTATLAVGPTSMVDGTTTATTSPPAATSTPVPHPPATRLPRPTRTPVVITVVPNGSPTPIAPTLTPVPPPVITEWRGEYFNNVGLIGDPAVVRNDSDINFDWLTGSPDPRINVDLWSARWTRSLLFEGGIYRFALTVDDGVRLFIDGALVLDDWRDGARDIGTDVTLGRGNHNVRVEYYERGGRAAIRLRITQAQALMPTPFPTWTRVPPTPTFVPTLTPIPIASATAAPTAILPTQPVPPPSQTPTIIPDVTSTPVPATQTAVPPTATSAATRTPTPIPEDTNTPAPTALPPTPVPATPTSRPTAVPPTSTNIPPTVTATDVPTAVPTVVPTAVPATPTIIPDATETATPEALTTATATHTSTPLPDDTATPEALATATETATAKRPTPTATSAGVVTPTLVAKLTAGELMITGTRWLARVNIGISAEADGSGATALGTAVANRRGTFTFATTLGEATLPNPLYVVVQDRRSRIVVRVVQLAPVEPPPIESGPAKTPIP